MRSWSCTKILVIFLLFNRFVRLSVNENLLLLSFVSHFFHFVLCIGWFQKISIPYHGGHEYFKPPLPTEIPKCSSLPCQSLMPPPLRKFPFFFRPFGIPVRLPETSSEWETCTFSPCKIILFTIFGQISSNSSLLTLVHRSYNFLLSVIFKLLTT